jgi:hypothetical protein
MTAPARSMYFAPSASHVRGISARSIGARSLSARSIGSVARPLTGVVLVGLILALYIGSAAAVGSFIWHDVPRIAGGALSALSQGSYGPSW